MPEGIGLCPSGFYDPDLNAHFVHVAGDSQDNGVMWVYRYHRVPDKKSAGNVERRQHALAADGLR